MKGLKVAARVAGAVLLACALMALGAEIVESIRSGSYRSLALGELWYGLDPPSLNLAQAVIERYVWPSLWDPVMITVLLAPGWPALGLVGLVLWWLGRRRTRRRRWFRSRRMG